MGNRSKFKKKATIYKLRWADDEELDGLEVNMRSLPISQFLEVVDLSSSAANDLSKQNVLTKRMFGIFASALTEWNLQDEFDQDVPAVLAQCSHSGDPVNTETMKCGTHQDADDTCTITGVLAQETDFIFRIFNEWQKAMSGVSEDLGKDSSSGKQFQEVSMPMETSSQSPQS
jgi:hypothetical protein